MGWGGGVRAGVSDRTLGHGDSPPLEASDLEQAHPMGLQCHSILPPSALCVAPALAPVWGQAGPTSQGSSHLPSCHFSPKETPLWQLGLYSLALLRRGGTCAHPWLQHPRRFQCPRHPHLSLKAFVSCFLLHTSPPFPLGEPLLLLDQTKHHLLRGALQCPFPPSPD